MWLSRVKLYGVTETFLNVKDAASALAVSPYTLREWLKTGKVRGVKIGTKWRVPHSALVELAKGTSATTGAGA